ncbi:MAG: hypothetical protein WB420_12905 [Bradyrhizobium sp.]
MELAFLELPAEPEEPSKGPWEQIDPLAQVAALALLSRLIAQMLAASAEPHPESGDE